MRGGWPEHRASGRQMADILRVTTPLVNKSQMVETKPNVDLATQFPVQDPTRVPRPGSQSELLGQNNGMLQQDETSALLLSLLKDPSVTVNFLKSISSMEAVIKLLPVNNSPFTKEIEQMFGELLVPAEDIAAEMGRQEHGSTYFKGELFDLLRDALRQNPGQGELRDAAVSFLKAMTLFHTRREALGSVANSLEYLAKTLSASKSLSGKLLELAGRYRAEDAPRRFPDLRQDTLALFREVEESILFTQDTEKVLRMAIYNLSRYNDNGSFLQESVSRMLIQLRGETARETFLSNLQEFLEQEKLPPQENRTALGVLTRILQRQMSNEELMAISSDKMEKIIHSLLSSPCNFTPLLHFVLPVQYQDIQSFAEVWINPNGGEDDRDRPEDGTRVIHMLLAFDVESIGRFELELFVRDKVIDFSLYCPPPYANIYDEVKNDLRSCAGKTGYRFGEIRVDRLDRPRSLMDVFKSLPYKRTGVDVTI